MGKTNVPAFVLVRPQLAENIGTAARAMMNCAMTDMRLVSPKESPLSPKAIATSSGAEVILKNAKIFNSIPEAIADLHKVYATTGRLRDMVKTVFTGEAAAKEITSFIFENQKCGVLFGPERTGLENDDVSYADAIINIPLNPEHCSLNLAQAVLIVGYEIFKNSSRSVPVQLHTGRSEMASKQEMEYLYKHLEDALDVAGYFKVPEKKPRMVRNIRNVISRMEMTAQEVRTVHGVIEDLAHLPSSK